MNKKDCVFPLEAVARQPTNPLHKLARHLEAATLGLKVFEAEHKEVLVDHDGLKHRVEQAREALETEAKQQARTQAVDFESNHYRIRVQKRNVRVVSTDLLREKSTVFFPGSDQRMSVAYACPDLVKISLKKLDEYVASGVIPEQYVKNCTEDGEPQLAFILEPKEPG